MPYYKWAFRALSELPRLSELYAPLEYLISSGNGAAEAVEKQAVIEMICGEIAKTLRNEGFSSYGKDELEGHSYAVNERIKDAEIRNMHILAAVS